MNEHEVRNSFMALRSGLGVKAKIISQSMWEGPMQVTGFLQCEIDVRNGISRPY